MDILEPILQSLRYCLIASCQALPDEPLHGAHIMARMAKAAEEGGASAIRANGADDVRAIKAAVSIPVIGIIKREYTGSDVYITPTLKEVEELLEAGADMIAFDATGRSRPGGARLEDLIRRMKQAGVASMADVSTLDEAVHAASLGVSCVSTTLSGYTDYSPQLEGPDLKLIEEAAARLSIPLIAEGRIHEPYQVEEALKLGAHAVVVGGAISRPQQITRRFSNAARKAAQSLRA